jgi:DNA-directed RNA polymerase specialized sigma24 family protein
MYRTATDNGRAVVGGRRPGRFRVLVAEAEGDRRERGWRALQGIDPADRQVVVEVALRGRTVAEAATALGMSADAVKVRLSAGLRSFRALASAAGSAAA